MLEHWMSFSLIENLFFNNQLTYKLQYKGDNDGQTSHKLHEVLNVFIPEEPHKHPEEYPRENAHHARGDHHQGEQVGSCRALVTEKSDYKRKFRSI